MLVSFFIHVASIVKKHCKLNIYIALELKEAVLNCDQQVMDVSEVDMIHDVESWLLPHIDTPHGHTNPHNFLFRLGGGGKAEMHYRNWSADPWLYH